MTNIKEIFENKIKIDAKVVSIESLFNNEDRLKNTNYKPSYQRNYVWDDEKATYFIESILLGTEIPPLIYFRNVSKVEIIDGRQRYETILRFLSNDFKLKKSGLKKLDSKEFINKNFENLELKFRDLFYETRLRIIEFSFNTRQGINDIIEDDIKKEIFKRYNTGITPLKNTDIERAEFLFDDVNTFFKEKVLKDKVLKETLTTLFYFERGNDEILLKKIRELLIIENIPIRYFANKKGDIINAYYEYVFSDPDQIDFKELKLSFVRKINLIKKIYFELIKEISYNRLISECLYWGFSILERETTLKEVSVEHISKLVSFIKDNISFYDMDRSSFSKNINSRYENIASIFSKLYKIEFDNYLTRNEEFNNDLDAIDNLNNNEDPLSFDDLRLNKTEPSSTSIDDIIRSIQRQKFIIRPQYQRNEVIDRKKRSSLIESILLGIKLPPLFIYKRKDGISEVIDGQQRLLSILSYMGNDYLSENYESLSSNYENFSLSLKNGILTNLHGLKFYDLETEYQEKIKNFDLWIIEIDGKYNSNFDPIDLFIRLNYKPYPIKLDSFEMWNSYIERDLINTIKDIYNNHKDWFYVRKNTSRMENENILTALIYLYYEFKTSNDSKYKALDYYKIGSKVNFRLRSKNDLTKKLETFPNEMIYYSNKFEIDFLYKLRKLINYDYEKSEVQNLDFILSVDNGRRTQQALYALWYFFNEVPISVIEHNAVAIQDDIRGLFDLMNNVKNIIDFDNSVSFFKMNYISYSNQKNSIIKYKLGDIAKVFRGIDKNKIEYSANSDARLVILNSDITSNNNSLIYKNISVENFNNKVLENFRAPEKIIINSNINLFSTSIHLDFQSLFFDSNNYGIIVKRPGIDVKYIYTLLSSNYLLDGIYDTLNITNISNIDIPFISLKQQQVFTRLYDIISECTDAIIKNYFSNIKNELVFGLYNDEKFRKHDFSYVYLLDELSLEFQNNEISLIYQNISSGESLISKYLLIISSIKLLG
ncbi:GmrSD restriction endonuclease domain-containing protein [Chryseobacterium scophthalmum]|uniref:GmrSD restriction endonuclease domain-containing protein n=1 Tax=Chryseobacterium scophthalmum TaxID=59733 RepID=UPI001AEC6AFE|nr:DUF262 domain-containing protein [Chryseobacterium scophthalmum]